MDLSEYVLETIHTDGALALCRGRPRTITGSSAPSILVRIAVADHLPADALRRLEHELSLRSELDRTWAVWPLALVHHEGRTALVLEDPGGDPLARLMGTPLPPDEFLRIAIGACAAMARLHRQGLVHKDVKPAHVMVERATGRAWLSGFGIASRLARERLSPVSPESIAGTLAYMAPEQTGRMNRSIDSRSDLYALGVVLYEMLTGGLPFAAEDPMEWVHCHVARQPVPPSERVNGVPAPISAIVMKLLAKTAEDRYQTAAGLERDLRRCLAEWERRGRIDEFPLGARDVADRILIPERLYGREAEVETLLESFDRVVRRGRSELVLVSGYSGIGKSSVVNELHKALVPPRALFASGKFDQYKRDIPYATLAQAFQSLVRSLLAKPEVDLAPWRDALREALGLHGQLIVDFVPELELIVGRQPPVPELPPRDAQKRSQHVFRRFIGVFARPEHPLALFLDDLQWLDTATLDVVEDLLTHSDPSHLLLVGAYRDNEVGPEHPVMAMLAALRRAAVPVSEVVLGPLSRVHLGGFIADALRDSPERVEELTDLVAEKTRGNPFFAIQFLTSLDADGLVRFDPEQLAWRVDVAGARARGYTDNVVALMVTKLQRLPAAAQQAVMLAACVGNVFAADALGLLRGRSEDETHSDLWELVREGLLDRSGRSYEFSHDRVQQAAYALIPEERRGATHLRIGQFLLANTPADALGERVFDIVNQLNLGASLLRHSGEKREAAELNLVAGRRAKASSAYEAAARYVRAGIALLDDGGWAVDHPLAYGLHFELAQLEYLLGNRSRSQELVATLIAHARDKLEKASAYGFLVDLYTTEGENDKAVAAGLECISLFGIQLTPHPTRAQVQRDYDELWRNLGGRKIEDLIDLPPMTDRDTIAALGALAAPTAAAMFSDLHLLLELSCHMVNLCLRHGNADASPAGYVWLGVTLGPVYGKYEEGYRFGKLAYDYVQKHRLATLKPRIDICFGDLINFWTKPLQTDLPYLLDGFRAAVEIGDLTYACYCANHVVTVMITQGSPLEAVYRESEARLEFVRKVGYAPVVDEIVSMQRFVQSMRGLTARFSTFDDATFEERGFEDHLDREVRPLTVCWYYILKLTARFMSGDYGEANEAAERAGKLLWSIPGHMQVPEYHYYRSLSLAAAHGAAPPETQRTYVEALRADAAQFREWAANCPENFASKSALVSAELARIGGDELEAMRLYERAIESARQNGLVQNEGIAYELASRFYRARGFEAFADTYLRSARACYRRWGADGKVRQLEETHPHLRERQPLVDPTATIDTPVEHLDLSTVLRISQAVSGEIVQEKLVDTLLRAVISQAGAERGLLIATRGGQLRVEAEARTTAGAVTVRLCDSDSSAELPHEVVRYAIRTERPVILDDASAPGAFSGDDYVRRQRVRSMLCLPLLKQGQVVAVLHLENNLAVGAFTPEKVAVLNVIAPQAAMSLENSRLYRELQQRETKIRRLVDSNIIGVIISDRDGRIVEANDAFLEMLDHTRDDITYGRLSVSGVTAPGSRDATERAMAQVTASGACAVFEKEYLRRDGLRVPVLIGAAAIDETQRVAFVLDLTERKRAEKERERLREVQADLARISRVTIMAEFTASLAHEIKQPIAAAVTNANACVRWLAREEPDLAEARAAAARIVADATRAADIINRVRSLYKKDAPRREPVDVNEVALETLALVRGEAQRSSIATRVDLAADLPRVEADRVQLQQVFMNLMVNGIEAMQDTAGELTVTSRRERGREVLITISDDGVGLPAGKGDEIFDAFFTTKPHGTGMGLKISRSIIESYGGRLWATPRSGRGASFHFALPAAEPISDDGPRAAAGVDLAGARERMR